MTYWDGTRWIPDRPVGPRPKRAGVGRRLTGATAEAMLITLLLFGLIAGSALAAKGGNGAANHREASSCLIDGSVVSATGLPTDEVINFMVTDASGTWGWVLGVTWEGAWSVTVPPRTGPTTYEFVSRTYGNAGSKYEVFSSCSTAS